MDSLGVHGLADSGPLEAPWPIDLFDGVVGFLMSCTRALWGDFCRKLAAVLACSTLTAGFHFSLAGRA
jgi:hypothetical protein